MIVSRILRPRPDAPSIGAEGLRGPTGNESPRPITIPRELSLASTVVLVITVPTCMLQVTRDHPAIDQAALPLRFEGSVCAALTAGCQGGAPRAMQRSLIIKCIVCCWAKYGLGRRTLRPWLSVAGLLGILLGSLTLHSSGAAARSHLPSCADTRPISYDGLCDTTADCAPYPGKTCVLRQWSSGPLVTCRARVCAVKGPGD